jgi:predicted ATPase
MALQLGDTAPDFTADTTQGRITFEETLRFERIHEETYRNRGFELIPIEPASVAERVRSIAAIVR